MRRGAFKLNYAGFSATAGTAATSATAGGTSETAASATAEAAASARRTGRAAVIRAVHTACKQINVYAVVYVLRHSYCYVKRLKALFHFVAYTHNKAPGQNVRKIFGVFVEELLQPRQFRF